MKNSIGENTKFKKLGDALRYALLFELHNLLSSEKEAMHLYACLAYMKYMRYIDQVS